VSPSRTTPPLHPPLPPPVAADLIIRTKPCSPRSRRLRPPSLLTYRPPRHPMRVSGSAVRLDPPSRARFSAFFLEAGSVAKAEELSPRRSLRSPRLLLLLLLLLLLFGLHPRRRRRHLVLLLRSPRLSLPSAPSLRVFPLAAALPYPPFPKVSLPTPLLLGWAMVISPPHVARPPLPPPRRPSSSLCPPHLPPPPPSPPPPRFPAQLAPVSSPQSLPPSPSPNRSCGLGPTRSSALGSRTPAPHPGFSSSRARSRVPRPSNTRRPSASASSSTRAARAV
jgi:hypothetical protein